MIYIELLITCEIRQKLYFLTCCPKLKPVKLNENLNCLFLMNWKLEAGKEVVRVDR